MDVEGVLTVGRVLNAKTGCSQLFGGKSTATGLLHHTVYAATTRLAYYYLDRSQTK